MINDRIMFYNEHWSSVTEAAHQFEDLSAIAFDEREEKIYFSDKKDKNGSIFSLKLSGGGVSNHITEQQLSRTQDEFIAGLAYDTLDQVLYWTDVKYKRIYRMSTQGKNNTPEVLFDFSQESAIPDGIAVDTCRRKLYWTNSNHKNPSIEYSSLDGSNRKILVDKNLYMPHGIAVDQFTNRIYWVVDQEGSHFSVESANLDGTDREIVVKGLHNNPFGLAVTKDSIYWTDLTHSAVWNASKISMTEAEPSRIPIHFPTEPKGIIARTNFLSRMENVEECKNVVARIKTQVLENQAKNLTEPRAEVQKREIECLNNGIYNSASGTCICKAGFTGYRCESDVCHNYCIHGTCNLSSMSFAECTCQEGFTGERCETYKCHGYCLNDGLCEIINKIPVCYCPESHSGARCENNATETCLLHCKLKSYESERHIPQSCYKICDNYGDLIKDGTPELLPRTCTTIHNKTIIMIVISVLVGLTLVLLIVESIRRMKKPVRPRIKKTFLVQKKISQTPLTSRPVATEQCEITIENCCNMNICDTPCFDPKLLQQNMAYDSCKEDKKVLINNMEEDLY